MQDLKVVSGLMVMAMTDRAPQGYQPVNNTLDSGVQAFKRKQLLVHFEATRKATKAITEILLLKTHKVPEGFKQLP